MAIREVVALAVAAVLETEEDAPMHLRQGAAAVQTLDVAQRVPAQCKAVLSNEDTVVNLF